MVFLDDLRKTLDRFYNAKLWNFVGALTVVYAIKQILQVSVLDSSMSWVVAAIVGVLFFAAPGVAVIGAACAVFFSMMHINGFMAVVLALCTMLMYSKAHPSAWSAIVLPLAFLPGSPVMSVGFAILFYGMCMYVKYENSYRSAFYPVLWGLWGIMTCSYCTANYVHESGAFNYVPAEGTLETIFEQFDPASGYNYLQTADLKGLAIVLGAFLALGILAYWLGVKIRLVKTLNHDVRDAVNTIVLIIATIGVYYAVRRFGGTEEALPIVKIITGGILGYFISRPWVTAVAMELEQPAGADAAAGKLAMVHAGETWDSLSGYEETKRELQEVIKPYVDKKEYNKLVKANMKPVKGILLYGPPGTGKTTMARIIANESKMNLILVNASQFMSMWVGESERNLVNIFTQARAKAPAIICFEEIEAFLGKRVNSERSYETSIINVFLTQMDGFKDLRNVLIIATTNNPEMIDEAALRPGRFDKIIYMGAPDPEGRKALFVKYLKDKTDLSTIDLDKLADLTERFTGADIKAVCEGAYRDNDFRKVTEADLVDRIALTLPSYTLDLQERYELYRKKYTRSSTAQNDNRGKEKPKLSWDDIKGMESTKAILKDKIESPIVNADKYKEYGIPASKGILLFGPPGCGKTFFAKVAADESNANFYVVNGPELLGAGAGESEANLRRKFRDARETKPSIIFFDEIDAIAGKRSADSGSVRIINQLLTEMDGMDSLDGVVVIAATNRPYSLDAALMRSGRFDTKIYIPMPDKESIKELLKSTLEPIPFDIDLDKLAEQLDGYTCADIVAVANKAKEIYVKRQIVSSDGKAAPVSTKDMLDILSKVKSSVSEEDRKKYEEMREFESIL
ncbi:MAG: AAA family ATPase [Mogibacterium sp.]|nr:AAA family ATPase [Mogibacterium sp.]